MRESVGVREWCGNDCIRQQNVCISTSMENKRICSTKMFTIRTILGSLRSLTLQL